MCSGRASRSEFFWFESFCIIIVASITSVGWLTRQLPFLTNHFSPILINGITSALVIVVGLALTLPAWSLMVRRLHDSGWSGWWIGGPLLPLMGIAVLYVFAVYLNLEYLRIGAIILAVISGIICTILFLYLIFTGKGAAESNQYGAPLSRDKPATAIASYFILSTLASVLGVLQVPSSQAPSSDNCPAEEVTVAQNQQEEFKSTDTILESSPSVEEALSEKPSIGTLDVSIAQARGSQSRCDRS